MTVIIAGVDPGISGAIAFYVPSVGRAAVYDMPVLGGEVSAPHLAQLVRQHAPSAAFIEAVHAMPGNGAVSMFNFGLSTGKAHGVIGACEVPMHRVTPQKWKKHFDLINQEKDAARLFAIEMFPAIARDLKRKKDHGRADALLIAVYGAFKILTQTESTLDAAPSS